ncbi:MAG: UpxY family transcription antiterminator [Candidatus Acidiferrum sp.]
MTEHVLNMTPAWFAVYTRHQHEKVVANILVTKGFDVFLPLYTAGHQWKDRTKQVSLPLFPCYVFLHSSLNQRVEVLRTPGVHQFVGFGGTPYAIPVEEIDAVRHAIDNSLQIQPHPFLNCGDRVRVKSGPLMGSQGILVRHKNQFRLVLSVDILNRSVAVEIDLSKVERLEPSAVVPHSGSQTALGLR